MEEIAIVTRLFFLPFPLSNAIIYSNCAVIFRDPCEMGLDLRPAAIYNGGIYMSFWNVLLVIIVILAILLVVLYILGSRMQKRQAEQQTMIDASKQTVSILAIDKKKLKIGDSGLPKMVIDQTPWYMKWSKLPIVKAKIGPKVVTMIADEKVFLQLPLRTEAKVVISGLYITEIKSVRGGIPPLPKKKKFFDRFKKNVEETAKKETSKSKKNK